MFRTILLFIALLSGPACFAQLSGLALRSSHTDSSMSGVDYDYAAHTYFGGGLSIVSDNVYNGRHDTLAIPYITPSLTYHDRSGLYATASLSYSPAPQRNRIDLYTLEAGYDREKPDYEAGLSISKYFYNASSAAIRSALSADANAYGEYSGWWIVPKATLDLLFSKKHTDYALSLGLNHTFEIEGIDLDIKPGLYAFGSTQHYYSAYFSRRKKLATTDAAAITDEEAFHVLNYELNMVIQWERGPLLLTLSPTYDLPVHPVELTVAKRTYTEHLSNIFWVQFDAVWRLKTGRKRSG